jgi:hypothetical protein
LDSLDYGGRRPVQLLAAEQLEDGRLAILRPKFGKGRFGQWMSRRMSKPNLRITLDDYGKCVWQRCDGEHSVEQIAGILEAEHGQTLEDAPKRLMRFLGEMERAGMIGWKS